MKSITRRNNASSFIKAIKDYVEGELGLKCKTEYRLGEDKWCSMADIAIEFSKAKLFIEIEEGQTHPDTNVTKYWNWMEKENIKDKIILIQVFGSKFYDNNYRSRAILCDFIARKIKESNPNFLYISIPKETQHKYSENWQISELFDEVKKKIGEVKNGQI
jgi:hypothetical protein